jgi:hypothetical protein
MPGFPAGAAFNPFVFTRFASGRGDVGPALVRIVTPFIARQQG